MKRIVISCLLAAHSMFLAAEQIERIETPDIIILPLTQKRRIQLAHFLKEVSILTHAEEKRELHCFIKKLTQNEPIPCYQLGAIIDTACTVLENNPNRLVSQEALLSIVNDIITLLQKLLTLVAEPDSSDSCDDYYSDYSDDYYSDDYNS